MKWVTAKEGICAIKLRLCPDVMVRQEKSPSFEGLSLFRIFIVYSPLDPAPSRRRNDAD